MALEAHKRGDTSNACIHYQRALEAGDVNEILYQNYGALLRELGKFKESEAVYKRGLELFPESIAIQRILQTCCATWIQYVRYPLN